MYVQYRAAVVIRLAQLFYFFFFQGYCGLGSYSYNYHPSRLLSPRLSLRAYFSSLTRESVVTSHNPPRCVSKCIQSNKEIYLPWDHRPTFIWRIFYSFYCMCSANDMRCRGVPQCTLRKCSGWMASNFRHRMPQPVNWGIGAASTYFLLIGEASYTIYSGAEGIPMWNESSTYCTGSETIRYNSASKATVYRTKCPAVANRAPRIILRF